MASHARYGHKRIGPASLFHGAGVEEAARLHSAPEDPKAEKQHGLQRGEGAANVPQDVFGKAD